jgi:hypothetical protein
MSHNESQERIDTAGLSYYARRAVLEDLLESEAIADLGQLPYL